MQNVYRVFIKFHKKSCKVFWKQARKECSLDNVKEHIRQFCFDFTEILSSTSFDEYDKSFTLIWHIYSHNYYRIAVCSKKLVDFCYTFCVSPYSSYKPWLSVEREDRIQGETNGCQIWRGKRLMENGKNNHPRVNRYRSKIMYSTNTLQRLHS